MSLDSGGKLGEPCRHGETSENNSTQYSLSVSQTNDQKLQKKNETKTRPLISTHDHKLAALHTFAWLISFCPPRPVGGGTVYGPSVRSHSCPGVALRAPACAAATLQTAGDVSGPHEELIFLSLLFGQAHPLVVTTLSQSFNCSQYDRGQTLECMAVSSPTFSLSQISGWKRLWVLQMTCQCMFVYVNTGLLLYPTSLFSVCGA